MVVHVAKFGIPTDHLAPGHLGSPFVCGTYVPTLCTTDQVLGSIRICAAQPAPTAWACHLPISRIESSGKAQSWCLWERSREVQKRFVFFLWLSWGRSNWGGSLSGMSVPRITIDMVETCQGSSTPLRSSKPPLDLPRFCQSLPTHLGTHP